MGDMGEIFNAMRDHRKALRAKFGVRCPQCGLSRPRAQPTIMLPGQRCKVDGYVDPRPRLTQEERDNA